MSSKAALVPAVLQSFCASPTEIVAVTLMCHISKLCLKMNFPLLKIYTPCLTETSAYWLELSTSVISCLKYSLKFLNEADYLLLWCTLPQTLLLVHDLQGIIVLSFCLFYWTVTSSKKIL